MNFQNASDTLQRLALQHQGLIDLGQAIQDLGGLANAKDELTAQVEKLRSDVEQAKLDLDVSKAEVTKAQEYAKGILDAAASNADGVLTDAKARAQEIVDGAHEQASLVSFNATARANEETAKLTYTLSALQSKADDLQAEILDLQAKRDAVSDQATSAEQKLAAVQAQLRKMVEA